MDDLEFSSSDNSVGASWISIVPDECIVTTHQSSRLVTFAVRITYFHPEESNLDWRIIASTPTDSDSKTLDHIWNDELQKDVDVHTQLDWESFTSNEQDHCDPVTSIDIQGLVVFTASSSGERAGNDIYCS